MRRTTKCELASSGFGLALTVVGVLCGNLLALALPGLLMSATAFGMLISGAIEREDADRKNAAPLGAQGETAQSGYVGREAASPPQRT
jgi:hypothetical protein